MIDSNYWPDAVANQAIALKMQADELDQVKAERDEAQRFVQELIKTLSTAVHRLAALNGKWGDLNHSLTAANARPIDLEALFHTDPAFHQRVVLWVEDRVQAELRLRGIDS